MKHLLSILFLATVFSFLPKEAVAGEKALGVRVGYNTRAESPVAGLWFQYSFSDHVRIAPNVDYYFRRHNTDALSINTNVQFPFYFGANHGFAVYPFAGLNYTSWNIHSEEHTDDASTRLNRFGLNFGAGVEYRISPTMKIAIEAKAGLVKSYSSSTISLGIGYCF